MLLLFGSRLGDRQRHHRKGQNVNGYSNRQARHDATSFCPPNLAGDPGPQFQGLYDRRTTERN
jgi:hypothetical protein